MAPTIKPMKTLGAKTSTVEIDARLTKAPTANRAKETRAADPMANPWKQKQEGSMVYNSDQVSSHF